MFLGPPLNWIEVDILLAEYLRLGNVCTYQSYSSTDSGAVLYVGIVADERCLLNHCDAPVARFRGFGSGRGKILNLERFVFFFPEATHGLLAGCDAIFMILPRLLNVFSFTLRMENNGGEKGRRCVCFLVIIVSVLNPKL